jgi:hypothetical protein
MKTLRNSRSGGLRGLFASVPLAAILWIVPAIGAGSGAGEEVTVELEYKDSPYVLTTWGVDLAPAAAFRKEPDFAGREVYRNVLQLGIDTNYHMGLARDIAADRLHLDINRNGDLTDDPEHALGTQPPSRTGTAVTVTNLTLTFKTSSGMRRLLANLAFYSRKNGCSVYVESKSYLQGRAVLGGREWQVGVVGGHDPEKPVYLLARPWSQRDRPFTTYGTPDLVGFSERVFLGGHAYGVRGQPVSRDGVAGYRLEFTEQQVKLGELRVSGKHVHRLTLADELGYTAILDQPTPAAKLPVGNYQQAEIWLRRDRDAVQTLRRPIRVEEGGTVNLRLGSTLKSAVKAERSEDTLVLHYKLAGADGGKYYVMQDGFPEAPKVRIQSGGKELASGQFNFG